MPIWSCLVNHYSVCIPPIISELSLKLWNLHQRLNGTRNENYCSYMNLPAFWVDACSIIDEEISRIDRAKQSKNTKLEHQLLKQLGNK